MSDAGRGAPAAPAVTATLGGRAVADEAGPSPVDPAISQEGLRKAEEYVQQEEGAGRRLAGWSAIAVTAIAISMSLFHLYAAYDIVPTQPLRYTHVAFVLVLSFLLFPMAARFRNRIHWLDLVGCVLAVTVMVYAMWGGDDFTDRATVPERWDIIFGVVLIVLVLEAARRTTGWIMPIVGVLFLLYAYFGPYLPPPWTHRGFDVARLIGHLYITLEGLPPITASEKSMKNLPAPECARIAP